MPEYLYFCSTPSCKRKKRMWHTMDECDTIVVKCSVHHSPMQRQIFEPQLMGASGGQFKNEKELLAAKQEQRKFRSRAHFKNEVLPKIKDPHAKRYFEKKYKGTKKIDHEKL